MSVLPRKQASTFDPTLFEEVQNTIAEQLGADNGQPDLEAHIMGEDSQTEEEQNLLTAQYCYELVNSPAYLPILKSWAKMVEREHAKFENAETDPDNRLRFNWRAWQNAVGELVSNLESAAELYKESLK